MPSVLLKEKTLLFPLAMFSSMARMLGSRSGSSVGKSSSSFKKGSMPEGEMIREPAVSAMQVKPFPSKQRVPISFCICCWLRMPAKTAEVLPSTDTGTE